MAKIYKRELSTPWNITSDSAVGALALDELNRWWLQLYSIRRRFYTWQAELTEENAVLIQGQVVSLQSDRFKLLETAKKLTIRRLRFDLDNNILTVGGWG